MSRFERLKNELSEFLLIIDQREIDDNEDLQSYVKYLQSLLDMSEDKPKCLDYLNKEMLLAN